MFDDNYCIKRSKPFVKWAGGKTQMLKSLQKFLNVDFNQYIEPFVGGGAVFFYKQPKKSIICDFNKELISAYRVMQGPIKIKRLLFKLKNDYMIYSNNEEMYYNIRKRKLTGDLIEDTARFIYLNKSCFNGIYRVNKSGSYNVPFGHKKDIVNIDERNMYLCMKSLQNTKILCGDFYKTLKYIGANDFVYLDPPYAPLSKTSKFTQYTKKDFKEFDQIRLKKYCDIISSKGAKFILNNSDVPLIKNLYKDSYNIFKSPIRRMIAANKSSRVNVNELIITNYDI